MAIAALWWRRGAVRLTTRRAIWLSVEILVCPAFLPNLVRKITVAHPIEADGAQVLVAAAPPDVQEQFLTTLLSRTEELIEETSPEEPERAQLRAYLATVRAAQTIAP